MGIAVPMQNRPEPALTPVHRVVHIAWCLADLGRWRRWKGPGAQQRHRPMDPKLAKVPTDPERRPVAASYGAWKVVTGAQFTQAISAVLGLGIPVELDKASAADLAL